MLNFYNPCIRAHYTTIIWICQLFIFYSFCYQDVFFKGKIHHKNKNAAQESSRTTFRGILTFIVYLKRLLYI